MSRWPALIHLTGPPAAGKRDGALKIDTTSRSPAESTTAILDALD